VPPRGINPEVPVYDRAILGFYKQSLVLCSFVLSPPRRTVLVLLLVLDCLHLLGSNTIFEAPESVGIHDIVRRGLGGAFRVRVPFH
jgi:hypothetical protein